MTTNPALTDIPDQTGRTAIITGANSGIGLEAARALAAAGAHVVLAVRDPEKGRAAADSIKGSTEVRHLDLADLASVRKFTDEWSGDIDLLINNAGVMAIPQRSTADGFEMQLGTNHLGHFALTNQLLPYVTGRVVTVASSMHQYGKINFDDLNSAKRYSPNRAYAQSKLANLLFTLELQRRLTEAGSPVLATAAHPGWAATNLQSRSENWLFDRLMAIGNRLFAQDAVGGAQPTLRAAVGDVEGASYSGPKGAFGLRGAAGDSPRTKAARDADVARRLWDVSEQLTEVTFPSLTRG